MNKRKFLAYMVINGDNQTSLANGIKISAGSLSRKINEKDGAEFTQGEIMKIKTRWHLTPDQLDEVFFSEKVS